MGNVNTRCAERTWNGLQRIGKRAGRVGNRRTNRDYSDNNVGKISKNTEKSPGNMKKLVLQ